MILLALTWLICFRTQLHPILVSLSFLQDIHRLLHQIDTADSSTKVIQHGDRIVDTINKKNQWKHRVVTEEMKAVLEERDVAVLKVSIRMAVARGSSSHFYVK